jgi:hypothetical protein
MGKIECSWKIITTKYKKWIDDEIDTIDTTDTTNTTDTIN